MKWVARIGSLVVVGAVLAGAPARAAEAAGARSFVTWVYAHYSSHSGVSNDDVFGKDMAKIFHPSLIALIKEDERLARGEVGALDSDPICDCQDDTDLAFKIKAVRAVGPARAMALVVRRSPNDQPEFEDITLDLARANGRWRVWDVRTKDTPSLRAMLIKSNREQMKK
jgi:hypothetical protein